MYTFWVALELETLVYIQEKIGLLKLIDKSLTVIKLLRHKRWVQENIEGYKESSPTSNTKYLLLPQL